MVKVPYQRSPSISPSKEPLRYFSFDTNPDMFGAGIGRAIQSIGSNVSSLGATLEANREKMRIAAEDAASNNAYVGFAIKQNELEAGYLSTSGEQGFNEYENYVKATAKLRNDALATLTTPGAKLKFEKDSQAALISGLGRGAAHAAKEFNNWTASAAEGKVKLLIQNAAANFGDEELFQDNLKQVSKEIAFQGKLKGLADEEVGANILAAQSAMFASRVDGLMSVNPGEAQRMFVANAKNFTPTDFLRIDDKMRTVLHTEGIADVRNNYREGRNNFPRAALVDGVSIGATVGEGGALTDDTAGMLVTIESTVPNIRGRVISSTGGKHADKSQHYEDRALDINVSDMSDSQKATFLDAAIAAGARGIGIYQSGNTIHLDTRRAPMVWGHSSKGRNSAHDPSLAPAWAQGPLSRLFNRGGRPGGVAQGDDLVARVAMAESSGGADRRVSSAGAIGHMQLLPDTARMVAKQLGLPFSLQRLQYDDQYNILLGRTYLEQQLRAFGGNEMAAVAAYNAGPGAVRKWISQFGFPGRDISEEEWASKIPFEETRNYVAKVFGRAGPGPSRRPMTASMPQSDFRTMLSDASALADAYFPGDATAKNLLTASLETDYNNDKKAEAETAEAAYSQLIDAVITPDAQGNKITDIRALQQQMRDQWLSLTGSQKDTIANRLKQNSEGPKGETPESLAKFQTYMGLSNTDPEAFQKADFAADSTLTPEAVKELIRLKQQAGKTGKGNDPPGFSEAMTIAGPGLAVAGIDKDDEEQYNKFVGAYMGLLATATEVKGKSLSTEDTLKIANELLKQTVTDSWLPFDRKVTWGFDMPQAKVLELLGIGNQTFEAVVGAGTLISPAERKMIRDSYFDRTGKEPTEEIINGIFARNTILRSRLKRSK